MADEKPKRVRRERYKGTHPKSFKEKYKELKPELYSDEFAKAIEKGRTPAGTHRSICVKEIMEILKVEPGQIGLDATLGYGGHSLEILKCLKHKGRLYATDVDPYELPKTKERLAALGYGEEIISIRKMNFSGIDQIVAEAGPLDFVLADLGVSSMQIDNPERGFSLKVDGPLDLRLNPTTGKSAAALLKSISQNELEEILMENADEIFHEVIASAIIKARSKGSPIETTMQLKKIISDSLESVSQRLTKDDIKKTCTRSFQALRIEVNNEFEVLDQFLDKLPYVLAPGGRVAILSFHSGEDRRVKKSFQHLSRLGIYSEVAPDPIRPTVQECFENKRARSAKLRWAVRAEE